MEDLRKGSVSKLLFKYAIPSIMGMLIISLYTVVDGIFIGMSVGANGLAAVNIAMPLMGMIMSVGFMFAIGGGTQITIELGRDNKKKASGILTLTLLMGTVFSIIVAALVFMFSGSIANILGASDVIKEDVINYFQISLLFILPFMSSILLDFVHRGSGNPKYGVKCTVVSTIINILLDYCFVMVLKWGVEGAAWATGIGQTIGFILLLLPILKENRDVKIAKPLLDLKIAWKIIYNGSSEFLTEVAVSITTFIFNIILMKRAGEMGVSAYSIICYINFLVMAILIGLSQAMQPIVSYNYGAGEKKRVREAIKITGITAVVVGISAAIIMWIFSKPLVSLYAKGNIELINMASTGAKIYAVSYLIGCINIIGSAYFTAVEDPKRSAIIAILRSLVFVCAGLMILPIQFGIKGVWMSVPFAEIITLAVVILMIKNKSRVKI